MHHLQPHPFQHSALCLPPGTHSVCAYVTTKQRFFLLAKADDAFSLEKHAYIYNCIPLRFLPRNTALHRVVVYIYSKMCGYERGGQFAVRRWYGRDWLTSYRIVIYGQVNEARDRAA